MKQANAYDVGLCVSSLRNVMLETKPHDFRYPGQFVSLVRIPVEGKFDP